jgi:hypothetical protein
VGQDLFFPIAGEICIRLAIHMTLEEEFLYPSLKAVVDSDEIDEALLDHQLAKRRIADIMDMTGGEAALRAKVHTLGHDVIRHIDEEDRELLRDARRAWEDGKIDLVAIGIQMYSRRRDLFTLVGSVGAEPPAFDVDLPADAVECVAKSRSTIDGEPWPELADSATQGQR